MYVTPFATREFTDSRELDSYRRPCWSPRTCCHQGHADLDGLCHHWGHGDAQGHVCVRIPVASGVWDDVHGLHYNEIIRTMCVEIRSSYWAGPSPHSLWDIWLCPLLQTAWGVLLLPPWERCFLLERDDPPSATGVGKLVPTARNTENWICPLSQDGSCS